MAGSNPFTSLERQNFPQFSPIFTKSASVEKGFRWSIDHLARLQPVDIDTDLATLAKTNGHSPENNEELQKASDKFFSQKTILPSPWTTSSTASANRTGGVPTATTPGSWEPKAAVPRRVTFSPFPPAMAYIREDSLVESELRDSNTVDAGTQTILTFPFGYDLERLLGPAFTYSEEDGGRDFGNSSLRRKLFGQPEKLASSKGSEDSDMQVDGRPSTVHLPTVPGNPTVQPTPHRCSPQEHSFLSTPLHPPSSSARTYPSYFESPAILFKRKLGTRMDSVVEEECENEPAVSSLILLTPGKELAGFSPIDIGSEASQGVHHDTGREVCSRKSFSVTPSKAVSSFPSLSPIVRGVKGGAPPPASPMATGKPQVGSSGKTTSTPNTAVMKRQLTVSPFASPVLKQPRTKRPEEDEEDGESNGDSGESDSEELAQPLSLADLQTETYDLTGVTSTGCTGYFTNFGLEEQRSLQPLHSTAYKWLPPSHTAIITSHPVPTSSGVLSTNWLSIPGMSQTNSACIDSGVAASSEFNGTTGASANDLGAMRSSGSFQLLLQSSGKEDEPVGQASDPQVVTSSARIDPHLTPKLQCSQQFAHTKRKQPNLPTIDEDDVQAQVPSDLGRSSKQLMPSQADSGVVASPDVHRENIPAQPQPTERTPEFKSHSPLSTPVAVNQALLSAGARLSPVGPTPYSTSPYLHVCTNRLPQSSMATMLRTTPSRYATSATGTAFPFGTYGNQGKFTSKSIFRSTVLPSRLKLHTTPSTLSSPNSLPLSVGGGTGERTHLHTPSRYCGVGLSRHGYSAFAEEVIHKKESLKAQLQFSSSVKSAYPFTSQSSTCLHTRGMAAPLSPGAFVSTSTCSRFPLTDMGHAPSSRSLTSLKPSYAPLQSQHLPPSPSTGLTGHLLHPCNDENVPPSRGGGIWTPSTLAPTAYM